METTYSIFSTYMDFAGGPGSVPAYPCKAIPP